MSKYICCPKCGFQYLPGEIFIADYLLGKPKRVIRNKVGEILGYEGLEPELNDTFQCENCGEEFTVNAHLSFNVNEESSTIEQDTLSFIPVDLFNDTY